MAEAKTAEKLCGPLNFLIIFKKNILNLFSV
jgi:hypothetical protein